MRTSFDVQMNKWVTSVFGALLILAGGPFLLMGGYALYRLFRNGLDPVLATGVFVVACVGAYCAWTGVRMIFGIQRKGGGLLSPFSLRIAGVLFATVPLLMMFIGEFSWLSILELLKVGFFFLSSAACFALASRRQHPVLGSEEGGGDT